MKIKYGIFVLMLFCVTLLSLVHSYQAYHKQRNLLIEGINKKLYTAAMMARATLPQDYHDNLINSSSITKEKFDGIVCKQRFKNQPKSALKSQPPLQTDIPVRHWS